MYGQYFDTSLAEAALWLLKVLAMISLFSLIVGIVTLPLFFFVLLVLNTWFWSLDESRSTDTEVKRSRLRKIASSAFVWVVPIVSFLATAFLFSYFFGNTGTVGDSDNPRKAGWGKLTFDEVTRAMARKMPKQPQPPPPEKQDPLETGGVDPEEEALKQPLMMVRTIGMVGLLLIGPFPSLVILLTQVIGRMGLVLIVRSLSRNLLRTSLTYLAVFVLVIVITSIWSVLGFLDAVTSEKESNFKAIITEKNQIPSQMKPAHEDALKTIIKSDDFPEKFRPKNGDDDIMTWAFVGGSLDPKNRTPQNSLFFFCMEPRKVMTMMDGLDDLTGEQRALLQKGMDMMEKNPTFVVLGKEKLKQIGKKVGDTIELTSFNYTGITFRLTIIGVFPEGRYDQSAIMNRQLLVNSLSEYRNRGQEHPLADKSLNLIWIRMPNKEAFEYLAQIVNTDGKFNPAVKMETASSAIGSFMEPFKDLIWGMRRILAPALLVTMSLVIANAISISVRERRTEMAVLKVLGFRPWMVMALVLGEALLIGALSGFMATATAFAAINAMGGLPLPIAFFPKFFIPADALWWGPVIGAGAAFIGSLFPAMTARSVKVSEVFSKVA